jgi:hypothetical protein
MIKRKNRVVRALHISSSCGMKSFGWFPFSHLLNPAVLVSHLFPRTTSLPLFILYSNSKLLTNSTIRHVIVYGMRARLYHYLLAAAWRGKSSWYTLAAKHTSLLKPATTTLKPPPLSSSSLSVSPNTDKTVTNVNGTLTISPKIPNIHELSTQNHLKTRRRVDVGGDAFFCATDHDAVALGKNL